MRGYGLGQNLDCLLEENYWWRQRIVPKVGKYLDTEFGTGRRVTQGYPASPMIFNIVVDLVVRAVIEEVCIPQEAKHVMGWDVGARNLVFNADDGRIAGRDHEWVKDAMTVRVAMFRQMGLETNLGKTRRWCTPPY